jgi:DNA gyrase subunit A (EC 5.99.1.3)
MTDEERPAAPEHNHGHIDQVDLQAEMQRSYLDYAMSVIVGRALPRVEDGLNARAPPCDLRHVRRGIPS